jgi:PTS system beta-glucosides-specific IIC component
MNYIEVSEQILDLVGGVKNVSNFTHCVTRLRFNVKDKSIVKVKEIEEIKGVMGSLWQGEQFQVIVGAESDKLYATVCKVGDFENQKKIDENLDPEIKDNKKFSWNKIVNKVFNYLSPMMTTVIPLMVAASLCKVISYLLGPDILGIITAESGIYQVLNFIYSSFFYFLPLYLGYVSAKVLNYNPIYGMFLGAVIMVPDFVNMVGTVSSISFLGLPIPVASYTGSFLPVVLGGVVCKYVLEFMEKHVPSVAKALLVPLGTTLVMAIVMLVVCAPLGTYIGNIMGNFFMYLSNAGTILRILGAMLLTIAWPFLILFGMHGGLSAFAIQMMADYGYDPYLFNTAYIANVAVFGIALGVALKLKNKENKSLTLNYFLTCILGGITEPILYGVLLKYRKSAVGLVAACGVGGLLAGILVPKLYVYTSTSILGIWACWMTPENSSNMIIGNAILVITFIVAVVVSYMMKYDQDDK